MQGSKLLNEYYQNHQYPHDCLIIHQVRIVSNNSGIYEFHSCNRRSSGTEIDNLVTAMNMFTYVYYILTIFLTQCVIPLLTVK
jgi:hypothetical protein